jgi:cholest-4-en-3-one 26-monooxygenase
VSPQLQHLADLSDPGSFVAGVPHETFRMLRKEDPVHWQEELDGPGFWVVTRHEHIAQIHRDTQTFSSELGGTSLEDLAPADLQARKSMIDMDPPRHNALRRIISRDLTPAAVRTWEATIRDLAGRTVDDAVARGEVDFVADVASELPIRVLSDVLGWPQEDGRELVHLSDRLLGSADPDFAPAGDRSIYSHLPFSTPAALDMFARAEALCAARRADPRADLVTRLVQGEADGAPLSRHELNLYVLLLATAGNETTRHTITGGLLAYLDHPAERERLEADPALASSATEEVLRWSTAIHHFRRTVSRDVDFHGRLLRQGDKITTWFSSANRDEDVFADPFRFDIGRGPNPHQAFGPPNVHFCVGAHLARLELRIVFEELFARTERIELTGPVERLRSNVFNGVKRMPVRLVAR